MDYAFFRKIVLLNTVPVSINLLLYLLGFIHPAFFLLKFFPNEISSTCLFWATLSINILLLAAVAISSIRSRSRSMRFKQPILPLLRKIASVLATFFVILIIQYAFYSQRSYNAAILTLSFFSLLLFLLLLLEEAVYRFFFGMLSAIEKTSFFAQRPSYSETLHLIKVVTAQSTYPLPAERFNLGLFSPSAATQRFPALNDFLLRRLTGNLAPGELNEKLYKGIHNPDMNVTWRSPLFGWKGFSSLLVAYIVTTLTIVPIAEIVIGVYYVFPKLHNDSSFPLVPSYIRAFTFFVGVLYFVQMMATLNFSFALVGDGVVCLALYCQSLNLGGDYFGESVSGLGVDFFLMLLYFWFGVEGLGRLMQSYKMVMQVLEGFRKEVARATEEQRSRGEAVYLGKEGLGSVYGGSYGDNYGPDKEGLLNRTSIRPNECQGAQEVGRSYAETQSATSEDRETDSESSSKTVRKASGLSGLYSPVGGVVEGIRCEPASSPSTQTFPSTSTKTSPSNATTGISAIIPVDNSAAGQAGQTGFPKEGVINLNIKHFTREEVILAEADSLVDSLKLKCFSVSLVLLTIYFFPMFGAANGFLHKSMYLTRHQATVGRAIGTLTFGVGVALMLKKFIMRIRRFQGYNNHSVCKKNDV